MKAVSIGRAPHLALPRLSEPVPFSLDLQGDREMAVLPPTAQLLTEGGDARIACDLIGANRYGCACEPQDGVLAYGSSTASTISPAGFAAAAALRKRLERAGRQEAPATIYQRELDRMRRELADLCGLGDLAGLEIIFGASGTDLHLFASQLMVESGAPAPLVLRVEGAETGRGVPDALAGRHFGEGSALGDVVVPAAPLDCGRPIEILEVKCRAEDGTPRAAEALDAEVVEAVCRAASSGRRVLLTLVDVSKTGLLAPSPACVSDLSQRFPDQVEVLVDACQFRLAPRTLRDYLESGFLVAVTGSKFITGPSFCGAIFVPASAAKRLRGQSLPSALKSYSARADWPENWSARGSLKPVANYGLLLRWEAALEELRAFYRLPEPAVEDFLRDFEGSVVRHLAAHPALEYVPAPEIDRGRSGSTWDRVPTIFPFLLKRNQATGEAAWLTLEQTRRIHELLRRDASGLFDSGASSLPALRCQLGQPVACGLRHGKPVAALRVCASSRLVVDALAPAGRGRKTVIAEALAAIDKAALLATLPAL
jgi:hypothetical protein